MRCSLDELLRHIYLRTGKGAPNGFRKQTPARWRFVDRRRRREGKSRTVGIRVTLNEYKAKYKLGQLGGFGGSPCANTLLHGNSRRCHAVHDACLPPKPVRDHHSGFRDKNGAIVAVFQPYISDNLEEIRKTAETWAASKNLQCRLSVEDSWYSPGETVLVEFRNPQTPSGS
jgi:hypothetical protein